MKDKETSKDSEHLSTEAEREGDGYVVVVEFYPRC